MSAETPNPRKDPIKWVETGQRVEARYVDEKAVHAVGRVIAYTDAPTVVIETDDGTHVSWRADLTVPVCPVEHVGLVKRLLLGAVYARREARDGEDPWVYLYGGTGDAQRRTIGDDVADTGEAIGAVAGSPADDVWVEPDSDDVFHSAWEKVRVENAPGLSIPDRQKVADLLVSGDVERAVRAAAAAGLTGDQAEQYVRDMEEWQTYLKHHGRTEVDEGEADRMRAMGFDKQPEFQVSDEDRALIQSVLDERTTEYVYEQGDGSWKLDGAGLSGVVADIVWAAIKRDRERGGR